MKKTRKQLVSQRKSERIKGIILKWRLSCTKSLKRRSTSHRVKGEANAPEKEERGRREEERQSSVVIPVTKRPMSETEGLGEIVWESERVERHSFPVEIDENSVAKVRMGKEIK